MGPKSNLAPVGIEPRFQHYAWGDREFIPNLFGLKPTNQPYAEAWLGAHKVAPSPAHIGDETIPLDQLVERDPEGFVGPAVHLQFGELPYLVKVLSAARPLSIQAHPSRGQAVAGYGREDAALIPLDSPLRTYRDVNHKPEILIALSPFRALAGFRPVADIAMWLAQAGKLAELLPPYDGEVDWLERLLRRYFSLPDPVVFPALLEWIERLSQSKADFGPDTPEYWVLECHRLFANDGKPDRGLLFVFLLNLVVLEPWQALFLDAGIPHAYLSGSGIEVMANSDNVLRGGLTPKHVDADQFLSVLRFEDAPPFVIRTPESSAQDVEWYRTPAEEFKVERLRLRQDASGTRQTASGPVLLMFLAVQPGSHLAVRCNDNTVVLTSAETCMLPHGTPYDLLVEGEGDLIRVSVPVSEDVSFRGKAPRRLAFGTSGLRGLVADITDLEVYVNVRGYLDYLVEIGDARPGGTVALAGDLRPSTDSPERSIMAAVATACRDAGFSVANQGRIPTPALSAFAFQGLWPSIMVTGSHIPFDRNGIKFNRCAGELLKADEAPLLRAVERARRTEYARPAENSKFDDGGMFRADGRKPLESPGGAALLAYVRRYTDFFPKECLRGVRIAVYQHSAVGRDVLVEILQALGAEIYPIGRTETFIPIDTEAISAADLHQLEDFARAASREIGQIAAIVSTDGDSDRPLIVAVDQNGKVRFIAGDLVGILVSDYLEADTIVVPVSATDAVDRFFRDRPIRLVRTRIGSPWVISAMNDLPGKRKVGFEANGGFIVGSAIDRGGRHLQPLPTRDAVLPIIALLHAAQKKAASLWDLLDQLPKRFGKSALIDASESTLSAFMNYFKPSEADVQSVRFSGVAVYATGRDGTERLAGGAVSAAALQVRSSLEKRFSAADSFARILKIDFRDGVRIFFEGGDIAHVRASGNAPQLRIYAVAESEARAAQIVDAAVREPDGVLRLLLADSAEHEFLRRILRSIALTDSLFQNGLAPKVIGTVSGTESARRFWQQRLNEVQPAFGAREAISFHEDLPVNQALGLLLLWHRLRDRLRVQEGALIAFVFGEGTRSTPFTETENGQKPALSSFAKLDSGSVQRRLSMVELALKYFSPVESLLRRSGFDGMVVKWGDEVQIPARDLSGMDPLFDGADIVRFVSRRSMTEFDAANKDWVGIDAKGMVTAFIPRRPLREMHLLADRGLIERRGDELIAGINLGSIAVSRRLLDELLDEFKDDVFDAAAERSARPDLDPQFFTALTIAAIRNAEERARTWEQYRNDLATLRDIEPRFPNMLDRLTRVFERFRAKYGASPRIVAMDFGDQYWGDVGQHRQIHEFYLGLNNHEAAGAIGRALAGLPEEFDSNGNILVNSSFGGARVQNSVLIDCRIESGEILNSVLIGTRGRSIRVRDGFDVESTVLDMTLDERAGAYKVVSKDAVWARPGERITTLFLSEDSGTLMRVHEDTDLRNKRDTYDVPVFGNPISFKEAHARMSTIDPVELDQRRSRAAGAVIKNLAKLP